jgi:hypothetical protein
VHHLHRQPRPARSTRGIAVIRFEARHQHVHCDVIAAARLTMQGKPDSRTVGSCASLV